MANETKTNGKVDRVELLKCEEDKEHYRILSTELQKEMEVIEQILQKYYLANRIFPQGKEFLYKWNIERNADSSSVEVFFREIKHPEHKALAKMAAPAGGPVSGGGGSTGPVNSPDVTTYSLVGAPPQGPSIPKP
jgi:hypothetical protein